MRDLTKFLTVHDEVRFRFDAKSLDTNTATVQVYLDDINNRIRSLLMAMAARDIKIVPFEVRLCGDWNEVLHC